LQANCRHRLKSSFVSYNEDNQNNFYYTLVCYAIFFRTKAALYSVFDVFYLFCLRFLTDVLINDSRTIPNFTQQIKSNELARFLEWITSINKFSPKRGRLNHRKKYIKLSFLFIYLWELISVLLNKRIFLVKSNRKLGQLRKKQNRTRNNLKFIYLISIILELQYY